MRYSEQVASSMSKTVGSVINSDSHLDTALMRAYYVQVKVWFLVLGKVLNPVVFDIGQLYLIDLLPNHTNQMDIACM